MSRSRRYLVNALILLLIGAHAVYRFFNERIELSFDSLAFGLVVAQGVVGFAGAIWFLARSRQALS